MDNKVDIYKNENIYLDVYNVISVHVSVGFVDSDWLLVLCWL